MSVKRMAVMLACLALAACGGVKKPDDAGNASGKVLEGSISDAMIDLDQSRAEAPLAGPGAGVAAGQNKAARDLLAPTRPKSADGSGAASTDAPASPQDQSTTAAPAAKPAAAHDKLTEKAAEPAATPTRPPVKPTVKPAVSAPAKPKAKPAFRKPTDDGGA